MISKAFISLREALRGSNASIDFDGDSKVVTIQDRNHKTTFRIDDFAITTDGVRRESLLPAFLNNNTTLIPREFLKDLGVFKAENQ